MNKPQEPPKSNRHLLLQYAGFGFQMLLSLALGVYAGLWLDKKIATGMPLLVWILPLLIISLMIYRVIKDTGKKRE